MRTIAQPGGWLFNGVHYISLSKAFLRLCAARVIGLLGIHQTMNDINPIVRTGAGQK